MFAPKWLFLFSLLAAVPLPAALEHATFDSAGKLTGLIHDGDKLELEAGFRIVFEGGPEIEIQPHNQQSPITRDGYALRWEGTAEFPNATEADFDVAWEIAPGEATMEGSVLYEGAWPLQVDVVDYVIDVSRARFVGGTLQDSIALTQHRPAGRYLLQDDLETLKFTDAAGNWRLRIELDTKRSVTVSDHWGEDGRAYRVRVQLGKGLLHGGEAVEAGVRFTVAGTAGAPPVQLTVDPEAARYTFDGYGANLCWAFGEKTTEWLRDRLQMAWTRHEWKLLLWDQQREDPGEELLEDFARIAEIDDSGKPWILSLWRIPERLWEDSNRLPRFSFARKIRPEKWPELLEMMTSYLEHLRDQYDAVPDYVSFNEPDLGVNIGLTAEEHRDAVKRIIGHLRANGFPEVEWVLGETANPREAHRYVLPTIADPEAMEYVGLLSFHSWMGASPEQYRAWAEVSDWSRKPLIIGEAGDDPGAYRNRSYDSYDYGLGEAAQSFDILRYAEPVASLYWQLTADYGVVREIDGEIIPTGRYYLMKHFTNLTPQHSQVLTAESDQEDVRIMAFHREDAFVVHLLNQGPAREARISGLPEGKWKVVTTTEEQGFAAGAEFRVGADGRTGHPLPARSFTTLVLGTLEPNG